MGGPLRGEESQTETGTENQTERQSARAHTRLKGVLRLREHRMKLKTGLSGLEERPRSASVGASGGSRRPLSHVASGPLQPSTY